MKAIKFHNTVEVRNGYSLSVMEYISYAHSAHHQHEIGIALKVTWTDYTFWTYVPHVANYDVTGRN